MAKPNTLTQLNLHLLLPQVAETQNLTDDIYAACGYYLYCITVDHALNFYFYFLAARGIL